MVKHFNEEMGIKFRNENTLLITNPASLILIFKKITTTETLIYKGCCVVCYRIEAADSNFPDLLKHFFVGQAVELARKSVQPPAKPKPKYDHFLANNQPIIGAII